jgi:anhydro-N-acetylmuramic acid kinase
MNLYSYTTIGIMSGTSADGLDLVLCRFERLSADNQVNPGETFYNGKSKHHRDKSAGSPENDRQTGARDGFTWKYRILNTRVISYSGTPWPERFERAVSAGGYSLMEMHRDFGRFMGEAVNKFLHDYGPAVPDGGIDLIASHGHTIFHRPDKGITLQIGDGAVIAAITGITTVSDFRRLDVALGGQGAPLVPAGDELLFGNYGYCLNLGGFANISFRLNGKRVAFDVCPVNLVLNYLAGKLGHDYDAGGEIARAGIVLPGLLKSLENLEFYRIDGPRSLGKEWLDRIFLPVLEASPGSVEDMARTVSEHIALRVAGSIELSRLEKGPSGSSFAGHGRSGIPPSLLITGGGARNGFLMELISEKTAPLNIVLPEEKLVDFKEALIFAFLGVLRLRNEVNCLSSVTGACRDSCSGIVHVV